MDHHQTRFCWRPVRTGSCSAWSAHGISSGSSPVRTWPSRRDHQDVLSRYLGTSPARQGRRHRRGGQHERRAQAQDMLAAALWAVRAVGGVIGVETQLGYRSTTSACGVYPSPMRTALKGEGAQSRTFPGPHRGKDGGLEFDPDAGGPGIRDWLEDITGGHSVAQLAGGLAQSHSVTGPWSLCRAGIPRCARPTGKDPGRTRRNGDLRPGQDGRRSPRNRNPREADAGSFSVL